MTPPFRETQWDAHPDDATRTARARRQPVPPATGSSAAQAATATGSCRCLRVCLGRPATKSCWVSSEYLERAASALHKHGWLLDEGLFKHVAPVHWDHINLTGDYTWRQNKRVEKGGFRTLRPMARP
jgi:hypothetical protein